MLAQEFLLNMLVFDYYIFFRYCSNIGPSNIIIDSTVVIIALTSYTTTFTTGFTLSVFQGKSHFCQSVYIMQVWHVLKLLIEGIHFVLRISFLSIFRHV